jgi:hypothetical protein
VTKVTGTELEIVTPAATEILGPEVDRLATLRTNARTESRAAGRLAEEPRRRLSALDPGLQTSWGSLAQRSCGQRKQSAAGHRGGRSGRA